MSRKTFNHKKIISCKVYSITEICNLIDIHRRTIQNWAKKGLKLKNPGKKPWLFEGADLKKFLKSKDAKHKIKLKNDEFFCMNCKKAVKSKGGIIKLELKDKFFENKNQLIILKGNCEHCNGKLSRLSSTFNLVQLGIFNKDIRV